MGLFDDVLKQATHAPSGGLFDDVLHNAPAQAAAAPPASSDAALDPNTYGLDIGTQIQGVEPGSIREKSLNAIGHTLGGFVPRSYEQAASLATPAVQGIEDIYNAPRDIQQEYENRNLPGQGPIYEAEQTPPWSQERFNAGADIVGQMLMAKMLAGQASPEAPPARTEAPVAEPQRPVGAPEAAPAAQESVPQNLQPAQEPATIPTPDELTRQVAESPEAAAPGELAPRQQPAIPPEDARYAGMGQPAPDTGIREGGTSISNAYTDAAREKYGLAPAVQEARKSLGQSLVEAQSAESREPGTARRLVDDINAGRVKSVDDTGDGLLTIETIDAQVERSAAEDAVNNAKTPDELDSAKARLQAAKDRQQAVYDADKLAGTHTARGLNARRMAAANDYTLTRMEGATRAAQNGRPLSDEQSAYIQDLQNRISTLEKQADQYQAGKVTPQTERMRIKSDAVTARKSGQSLGDFLSEKADAARARIRQMQDLGVPCV